MTSVRTELWRRVLEGQGGTVVDLQLFFRAGRGVAVLALTPLGVFVSDERWGETGSGFRAADAPPLPQSLAVGYDPVLATPTVLLGSALGLFRSAPERTTWDPLFTGLSVTAIGMTGRLGVDAPLLAATVEKGLLRSLDGGATWIDANAGLTGDPVVAVAFSPLYGRDRTIFLATDTDVFRSRNGGQAWRRLDVDLLPQSVQCLSASMVNASRTMVLVGSSCEGLWSSDDEGKSWHVEIATTEIRSISPATFVGGDEQTLVVAKDGLYLSASAEQAWQHLPIADLDACCSVVLPAAAAAHEVVLLGRIEDGIVRGRLGTGEWTTANKGLEAAPRTQLLVANDDAAASSWLIVSDDNRRLLLSRDRGNSWQATIALPSPCQGRLALLPSDAGKLSIMAATDAGVLVYDTATDAWNVILAPTPGQRPLAATSLPVSGENDRAGLLAVMDDGSVLSRGPNVDWESGGQPFGDDPIIAAELIPSRVNATLAWAAIYSASHEGGLGHPSLWHTRDGGRTWTPWIQSSSPSALVTSVTATASRQEVVFIGLQNAIHRINLRSTSAKESVRA